MKIGAVYPQTEYGSDPEAIRDYAQTAEALGYHHVVAYDHVLGANPNRPGGWNGPYTVHTPFLSPLVLFAYMAAATHQLGFLTSILILPQRQTALVAKQAATLDVLCQGRLRLGVGLGWNDVEYIALNEDFHNRGKRIEEQIQVLKKLWTEPLVTFSGNWHEIPDAGINPLPVQKPIPIWLGGHADRVLRRIARLGDGWLPNYRHPEEIKPLLEKLIKYLEEEDRNPDTLGLEGRLPYADGDPTRLHRMVEEWQAVGADFLSINTMGSGFQKPQDHLDALRKFAQIAGIYKE